MKSLVARSLVGILLLIGVYSCKKEYSYEGGPPSLGYLVKDANNNCSQISVSGTVYIGKSLADSNFLVASVYVSRAGRFSISSATVNGYSFAANGIFKDTGYQYVKLPGSGKPLTAGNDAFPIQFDSSSCQANVTVSDTLLNVVQVTNSDYFPLAAGNRWVYDDLSFPGDSVIRTIVGDSVANAASYYSMNEFISFYPANNPYYFRKAGSEYLELSAVSTYSHSLDYAPTVYGDLAFLKEDAQKGDTWYSETFIGLVTVGLVFENLRFQFQVADIDATVTINGMTFQHVIKMNMYPQVASPGDPLVNTGEIHTFYFAKGVGLIYRETYNGVATHPELQIRSWQIH